MVRSIVTIAVICSHHRIDEVVRVRKDLQVDQGGLQVRVPQPDAHRVDGDTASQPVPRRRVAESVVGDAPSRGHQALAIRLLIGFLQLPVGRCPVQPPE